MIRNINPFSAEYYYQPTDLICSAAFESQPFNMLLVSGNQDKGIHIQSDIELLRRQQEYAKQHPELFQQFFEHIAPDSPTSKLAQDLSDDELKMLLKSRRFQSPAELRQYVDYLDMTYQNQSDALTAQAKKIIEDYIASIQNSDDSFEPKPQPQPKTTE